MNNIIRKADFNLIESIKNIGVNSPMGKVVKTKDYLMTTIGLNTTESHANAVFSLNDSDPEKVFEETNNFFKERKLDYTFWIGADASDNMEKYLKELEYKPSREPGTPLMVISEKISLPSIELDIEYKKVKSQKDINDFIYISNKCFELGEDTAKAMFNSDKVLNNYENAAYIIYYEDEPVSGVQIYKTEDIAGIYWVSTMKEMRGKGLGKYISVLGTNKAFDMNVDKVILQASKLGQYVYDKIGYDLVGHYRTYKIENSHK